jgi:hypothetical protein
MNQQIYAPNIIGQNNSMVNPLKISGKARIAGPIINYEFKSLRVKKQLKELKKILTPERKKFIFKFGYKFNIRDRCIVCGAHHIWEAGDVLRPPIPLSHVTKGRPLQGTYCPKHASIFKQLEMLEQQIIAEKHGLEFKRYIPKPKLPQIISKGPLVALSKEDIVSLTAKGWEITPPKADSINAEEKLVLLLINLKGRINQIEELIGE